MKELEQNIKHYLVERGWDTLRPSDIAKSISIEAAELLEIFQWSSLSIEETQADEARMNEIKSELADVLIYALEMGILLNLDVEAIVKAKLEKVKKKYPAELMRAMKDKAAPGTDNVYLRIKKEARKNAGS